MSSSRPWLLDAAELLTEEDPGPTPFLVDGLIVERALVACVGRWKTTKSYALLHICAAVASGRQAFGTLEVPVPGPVVFANEESGRAALWRRLDALARGSAIDPEELRGQLMVAANAGIRLDDPGWQAELVAIGKELKPRLFALDPLARMKAPALDENEQKHMAALIEFLRHLREETDSTVAFVHHTGHAGGHMRGSSDLESVWESRLTWNRDGHSPLVTLESEHREAEAGERSSTGSPGTDSRARCVSSSSPIALLTWPSGSSSTCASTAPARQTTSAAALACASQTCSERSKCWNRLGPPTVASPDDGTS